MNITSQLIEKAFLASILNDRSIIGEVSDSLTPEEFLEPKNEIIYRAVLSLYEKGSDTSVPALVGKLNNEGILDQAGGINYLREIFAPSQLYIGADPIGLSVLIKEEALRRDIELAADKIKDAHSKRVGNDAGDLLSFSEGLIQELVNKDVSKVTSINISDFLDETIDDIRTAKERAANATSGVPSGFPDLDNMTDGFKPGQMIIVAARPAVGKSTIAVDFARNASLLGGKTVLFFSMEMDKKEIVNRILSAEARVETQKIKRGELDDNDWMNISEAQARLAQANFIIDDNPQTSISRVRSVAIRQKNKPEGLDMIVIDYLGLMEIPSSGRSSDSRQNDISNLSRNIKLLAKELQIPVIILSQLNRNSETRNDRKPMVSDLRESGSLEQDADIVMLLHRPETADPNNRPGETDLIIGKHRGGPTGTVPLTSMLSYSKFVPGQGQVEREPEFIGTGEEGSKFATTEDEEPW